MSKSVSPLKQLAARVAEQALELANLRAALGIQFTRIAQMQAQLDRLPAARKGPPSPLLELLTQRPSHNGDARGGR